MKRVNTIVKNISRIENMVSPSSGREVPNQFKIHTPDGTIFQSYRSVIAIKTYDGRVILDENKYDCSATTMKYLKCFLGHGIKETRELIKSGSIKLAKLN